MKLIIGTFGKSHIDDMAKRISMIAIEECGGWLSRNGGKLEFSTEKPIDKSSHAIHSGYTPEYIGKILRGETNG